LAKEAENGDDSIDAGANLTTAEFTTAATTTLALHAVS
jgi:hypothetical protein